MRSAGGKLGLRVSVESRGESATGGLDGVAVEAAVVLWPWDGWWDGAGLGIWSMDGARKEARSR